MVYSFNAALKAKLEWSKIYKLTIPDRALLVTHIIADVPNHHMLIRNTNHQAVILPPPTVIGENLDVFLNLDDELMVVDGEQLQGVEDVVVQDVAFELQNQNAAEMFNEEEDADMGEEEELQDVEGVDQENSQPESVQKSVSDKASQESEEPQPSPPKHRVDVFY